MLLMEVVVPSLRVSKKNDLSPQEYSETMIMELEALDGKRLQVFDHIMIQKKKVDRPTTLQEKMQFLTYIILTYDNICQYCVFKLSIMTYITYFKAIMTFVHDLG